MAEKILLLGHGREKGLALARALAAIGLHPLAAGWEDFSTRAYGRDRPRLILANADSPLAVPLDRFCPAVRKAWGSAFPIIAVSAANRFSTVAALLDAGADDCLSPDAPPALLERKLSRCLWGVAVPSAPDAGEETPEHLRGVFAREGLIRLGDLVSVHSGAAPRRPAFRRMAPPDEEWRGVLTSEAVDRFRAGKPDVYFRWTRFHLFRLPHPSEYAVAEKVLLRRAGPPLAAAVDRSRCPVGTDVYSLVPREGVGAGYVACLLNSRLLDFYFNRVAGVGGDGRLRVEDVREAPVPRPTPAATQDFSRTAALLAHFGPNPQGWIDRQSREELWEHMEEAVFALYGAGNEVKNGLEALHF